MAHGPQKYTAFANEKLNDEFAIATVARLLRSNGAKGSVVYLIFQTDPTLRSTSCFQRCCGTPNQAP